MPALSEREPKVRLRRRFSKNKIGRGTLFYFCGSLFLSCRRWTINPGHRPGEEKGKNPLAFPGFPCGIAALPLRLWCLPAGRQGFRGGKSEPFHRFLLPYLKGVVVGFRMREGGSFA